MGESADRASIQPATLLGDVHMARSANPSPIVRMDENTEVRRSMMNYAAAGKLYLAHGGEIVGPHKLQAEQAEKNHLLFIQAGQETYLINPDNIKALDRIPGKSDAREIRFRNDEALVITGLSSEQHQMLDRQETAQGRLTFAARV